MAIKIYNEKIEFDDYTLTVTDDGFEFDGVITSPEFAVPPPPPMAGTVSGYASGGGFPFRNTIDKFPFASDANATDVGDLTQVREGASGQSSTENGYTSGGYGPTHTNTIDKFPFASDANATDVGDLSQIRWLMAGQQD